MKPSQTLFIAVPLFFSLCLATFAVPAQKDPNLSDFYRLQVGKAQVTVLLDGISPKQPHTVALQPDRVKELLDENRRSSPLASSYNVFLVHTGEHLVLVDAGGGKGMGNHLGHLVESLDMAGYQPEQIDAVLITHFHPDHIGGLVTDGGLTFPNAEIYCDSRESEYWLSENEEQKAPAELKGRFKMIQSIFAPVQKANRLRPFESGKSVLPGIEAISQPGHTPGHTAYIVKGQDKDLLLWGDVIHIEDAQFAQPSITVKYDSTPDLAIKSRLRNLDLAVERKWLVGGAHLSFPGLGQVIQTGSGYRWVPVPYGQDY